ncbi:hypothetical protein LguiB_001168 [Lonicera macranthoides]
MANQANRPSISRGLAELKIILTYRHGQAEADFDEEWHTWPHTWKVRKENHIESHVPGTQNVKVLRLHSSDFEEIVDFDILVGQDFGKLPNLRYLSINRNLDGDFKNLLQNLRWLHCRPCPGNCAPTNLHVKNLVVLNLFYSYIRDDWGAGVKSRSSFHHSSSL